MMRKEEKQYYFDILQKFINNNACDVTIESSGTVQSQRIKVTFDLEDLINFSNFYKQYDKTLENPTLAYRIGFTDEIDYDEIREQLANVVGLSKEKLFPNIYGSEEEKKAYADYVKKVWGRYTK